jgi:hypothetical protein
LALHLHQFLACPRCLAQHPSSYDKITPVNWTIQNWIQDAAAVTASPKSISTIADLQYCEEG